MCQVQGMAPNEPSIRYILKFTGAIETPNICFPSEQDRSQTTARPIIFDRQELLDAFEIEEESEKKETNLASSQRK